MADVDNLNINLGDTLDYFHNGRCEQVLENIIDPMVMMIRLCQINGWMFLIFVRISGTYLFLSRLVRINMESPKGPPK